MDFLLPARGVRAWPRNVGRSEALPRSMPLAQRTCDRLAPERKVDGEELHPQ